ncbi:uncharacterized protein [Henckelia pumila]|uniref:uncharacterized protein n=1 Tax=Henckelia pumila TaxID=405737 RepID=UPI003C6DFEE9
MSKEVEAKVKEKIEKLLKLGFIRPIRYTEWLSNVVPVYIDDIVVKSKNVEDHLDHLKNSFERMRNHDVKLNPLKCAFGVKAWNFLGFLVHQRGMDVNQNNSKVIMEAKPPCNKKKLQRFLVQVNYLRRFISNLVGKTQEFSPLLKLKDTEAFVCGSHHQEVFKKIKEYLSKPPILMPPRFLAHHPGSDESIPEEVEIPVYGIEVQPLILKFYGSSTEGTAGVGVVIMSTTGVKTTFSFNLAFPCTNNQAEYETLVIGLEVLKDFQENSVLVIGDSQLLADDFKEINFQYVPKQQNWEANELAQIAYGLKFSEKLTHRLVLILKKNHPSINQRGLHVETFNLDVNLAGDLREELKEALQSHEKSISYGLKMKSLNYLLVEGNCTEKGIDGLLLRCIGFPKALEVMKHVHEGVCGAHQSEIKMRWLVRRHRYYCTSMLKDCIKYSKRCQPCQKHGNIQRVPVDEIYAIVKP